MSNLCVLHISDSHFGCTDENEEMPLIIRELGNAVSTHINTHTKPDLCIFSGDLAYSGKNEEFEIAETWLHSLLNIIGKECPLFIVPGNHDVRRPDQRDETEPKRSLRHAFDSEGSFRSYNAEVSKGPCLIDFYNWHKETKSRIPSLVSDWDESIFGSFSKLNLRSVPIAIIGLNTAILSCGDDDKNKLVAKIAYLNSCLAKCVSSKELIILVSHHPMGVNNENDRWLVDWNDQDLGTLMMQRIGPHLYLHGHLHEARGYSMNMASGQSLTFFAAGAAYQGSKYPQRFAFYDIDLLEGAIQPHVYMYNHTNGTWINDSINSNRFQAALPRKNQENAGELWSLIQAQNEFTHQLKELIKDGEDDFEIQHLGLDFHNAHVNLTDMLKHHFDVVNSTIKILAITDKMGEFKGFEEQTIPLAVKLMVEQVPKALISIFRELKDKELNLKYKKHGKKIKVEIRRYAEIPTIHGFSLISKKSGRIATYLSFCRWNDRGTDLKWGEKNYRRIIGEPNDQPSKDMIAIFQGTFAHLWASKTSTKAKKIVVGNH